MSFMPLTAVIFSAMRECVLFGWAQV